MASLVVASVSFNVLNFTQIFFAFHLSSIYTQGKNAALFGISPSELIPGDEITVLFELSTSVCLRLSLRLDYLSTAHTNTIHRTSFL